LTPQNQDLGGRRPSLPEPSSGQRHQIDQQPQKHLESRDHGFMMPHLLGVGTSTVAIELMRSTGRKKHELRDPSPNPLLRNGASAYLPLRLLNHGLDTDLGRFQ
jgi:hypothetical protein